MSKNCVEMLDVGAFPVLVGWSEDSDSLFVAEASLHRLASRLHAAV
jgi:hypothetical protein